MRIILWITKPVLLVLLASCSATEIFFVKKRVLYAENPVVIPAPTMMDLDVAEEKVEGSFSGDLMDPEEGLKNSALYQALKSSGSDILVEPVYQIKKVDSRRIVVVSGFPARIRRFRPVTKEDVPLLELRKYVPARYYAAPVTQSQNPVKRGRGFRALMLLVFLPLLLLI